MAECEMEYLASDSFLATFAAVAAGRDWGATTQSPLYLDGRRLRQFLGERGSHWFRDLLLVLG